jgi:hypothetical protein
MSNANAMLAAALAKRVPPTAKAAEPKAQPQRDSLVWENVDPATLPDDIRDLYHAIGKARFTFEHALDHLIEPPAHLKLAFAYKRGLAIALAPRVSRPDGLAALIAKANAAE